MQHLYMKVFSHASIERHAGDNEAKTRIDISGECEDAVVETCTHNDMSSKGGTDVRVGMV